MYSSMPVATKEVVPVSTAKPTFNTLLHKLGIK
jgi:hypothetical protein